MNKSEIFISYAWGGESETIVNELDNAFNDKDILLIRDKRDLGFKGIITDFMDKIGTGKGVVVVISDKYLKSPYCMYELLEIYRNLKFQERIFPIVLGDANIFDPVPRLQYLKYWRTKKDELDEAIKEFGTDAITVIGDDYKTYKRVFDNFGEVINILKDINSLTPQMHRDDNFNTLIDAVIQLLNVSDMETRKQENDSKSEKTSHVVNNTSTVNGNNNIVFSGVNSNGNISINVNSSNSEKQKNERMDTSLQAISDSRKTSMLKRLDMQYNLLDQYEEKLMLEEDPKRKMSIENEIERLNQQIEKLEKDIKSM